MDFKRFGLLTLLSGLCVSGATFLPNNYASAGANKSLPRPECNNGPVMFGHRNFEGRVVSINRSYGNLSSIDFNDKAGSVCLPSGWTIELFNHANFNRDGTPTQTLYGPDSLSFFEGSRLNDKVTSVRVYYNSELR